MNVITKSLTAITPACLWIFCSLCSIAQENVPASAKEKPPKASVQIVNAISAGQISLFINGKSLYPWFPQGLCTADAPLPELNPLYRVVDPSGKRSCEFRAKLEPGTNQSLVLIGDFSAPEDPALYLPGVLHNSVKPKASATAAKPDESVPNIRFLVFDHKPSEETEPFRYRIVNGMPGIPLTLDSGPQGSITVEPGSFYQLTGQKPVTTLSVTVQKKAYPIFMNQQGLQRNALIIFYKSAKGPAFMRAFENTGETFRLLEELEKAERPSPKP
jgi:hypothetical protein